MRVCRFCALHVGLPCDLQALRFLPSCWACQRFGKSSMTGGSLSGATTLVHHVVHSRRIALSRHCLRVQAPSVPQPMGPRRRGITTCWFTLFGRKRWTTAPGSGSSGCPPRTTLPTPLRGRACQATSALQGCTCPVMQGSSTGFLKPSGPVGGSQSLHRCTLCNRPCVVSRRLSCPGWEMDEVGPPWTNELLQNMPATARGYTGGVASCNLDVHNFIRRARSWLAARRTMAAPCSVPVCPPAPTSNLTDVFLEHGWKWGSEVGPFPMHLCAVAACLFVLGVAGCHRPLVCPGLQGCE